MGIDYGRGQTNIDRETGIRYGVIHANDVGQGWYESSEANFGEPHCPKCGNEALKIDDKDVPDLDELDIEEAEEWTDDGCEYACVNCKYTYDSDKVFGDEPISHYINDEKYQAEQGGDDCDIFVFKSPYYTLCDFCSPCAPGAGYLMTEGHVKAYCFGHDMFEEEEAPYRVFRVEDDVELVMHKVPVTCTNCDGSGYDNISRIARIRGCTTQEVLDNCGLALMPGDSVKDDGSYVCWRCRGEGKTYEKIEEEVVNEETET